MPPLVIFANFITIKRLLMKIGFIHLLLFIFRKNYICTINKVTLTFRKHCRVHSRIFVTQKKENWNLPKMIGFTVYSTLTTFRNRLTDALKRWNLHFLQRIFFPFVTILICFFWFHVLIVLFGLMSQKVPKTKWFL